MRTIVVGDIHGCVKALQGLLDAIQPTAEDRLVFLGDYVDRGPDSRGVIDLLLQVQATCQTVFLLGNHEIMFRCALDGLDPELWLKLGGKPTLASYGGLLRNVSDDHRQFLRELLPYHEDEHNIFVHANYMANLPLEKQPDMALFWEHLSDRLPDAHCSGKHVYLGHTPQQRGTIGRYGYLTCVDTGCFAGLWLSAIDVSSQEVWQVSSQGHLRRNWDTVFDLRKAKSWANRWISTFRK